MLVETQCVSHNTQNRAIKMLSKQIFNLFRLNHSSTFYSRPESQPFLETVGAPANVYAVSTLHVTFETGWPWESTAGSGGSWQAVGTNLNSANTVMSAAAQLSYAHPGMAPVHKFRRHLSLWLTLKYRGGSTDKTRDSVFNISRQSKIGTARTRLIITKWWIKRG